MKYLAVAATGVALVLGASFAFGTQVQAEQSSQCKAAKDFMEQQVKAGLDPLQYTPDEIQWLRTYQHDGDCTPVPKLLSQRMMGTALPTTYIHTTCHSVMDWMLERLDAGESFSDEDMAWGQSYVDSVGNGEKCDAPPKLLTLRAYGHRLAGSDMKKDLADAMNQAGDGDAAWEIAMAYLFGTVVSKDVEQGYAYLLKASELGSPAADWELSSLYFAGKVEGKGNAEGIEYLKRAAEGGIPIAMLKLGVDYQDGTFVKKDPAEAYRWFNAAIEHGSLMALPWVADQLFEGKGVKKDREQAIELMRTGARAGDPLSMLKLVSFLLRVDNSKQLLDREGEVQYWFKKAVASGNPAAIQTKAKIGSQIDELFEEAKYSPPPVRACPRVLKCDVYYYNSGRQSQKVCAEFPSWRACSEG